MPLITEASFTNIVDRAARQYGKFAVGFEGLYATSTAVPAYFTSATIDDDPDVEIPLVNSTYNADNNTVTPETAFSSSMSAIKAVIPAMDSHFLRPAVNLTGSFDGYCSLKDMRVSDYFNRVYKGQKGSYMYAVNVFSETDDLFGTVTATGDASPTFVDGTNYGTGGATVRATDGKYAATQLRIKMIGSSTTTTIEMAITGKDEDNNAKVTNVTVPSGTAENAYVDVGTATDRFLDVTSVAAVNPNYGTAGNIFEIYNKKERTINLDDTL